MSVSAPDKPRKLALVDFVDPAMLQSLQNGFARLTGISTSIRDPAGAPIVRPAQTSEFCELVQAGPAGSAACRASHAQAASVAAAPDQPCRLRCHAGLSQFAAPIVVGGQHLGTIILGDRPEKPLPADALTVLAKEIDVDPAALASAAGRLKLWEDASMSTAAAFVQQLANTIAELCYQSRQFRQRVDELAVVYDLASMLAGRTDVTEIIDAATKHLVTTMGLKAASIRLLDEDTGELRIASVTNLSLAYLNKGPVRLERSKIDQLAVSGQTVYVEDMRTDSRTLYRKEARHEGLVSALVTGLSSGGRTIGVLRAYMGRVHRFSAFEVSLLEAIASHVAAAIVNARLRRDAEEAERLDRQVKLAAEVQRRMIPAQPPQHPAYEFGCVYEPHSELGGDFYDFLKFPNSDLGIVIADVVGKGVPASLMMASTRSTLRAFAKRVPDIADVMREVNLRLYHDTLPGEFVTAFYGVFSEDGRWLSYCNAGHEPVLILRQGGIIPLEQGGVVLGLDPAARYESAERELAAGDLIVMFTDGLLEARSYSGRAYGRERLRESVKKHGGVRPALPVELVARQLLWDVRRFVGLAPMSDDCTIVVVRVR